MDLEIEPLKLVATVFSKGPEDEMAFLRFLDEQMVSLKSTQGLKIASKADPLVVTEYSFVFESSMPVDLSAFRKSTYQWAKLRNLEVSIQRDDVFRRYRRLVVFDMDSTLIKQEVIDEIALYLDSINPEKSVGAKVAVTQL